MLWQPISSLMSFPKGSKAASLLLYSLWNDKNLQAAIKKVSNININLLCIALQKQSKEPAKMYILHIPWLLESLSLPCGPTQRFIGPVVQSQN